MEWDPLAGGIHRFIIAGILVYPTRLGYGMVAGDIAEAVASAGAGMHPAGTPSGKNKIGFLRR